MRKTTWCALAAAALALPFLASCGLDDVNQGQVRLLNATSEYATMDLYDVNSNNDSNLLISGTQSNAVSGYQGLTQGAYTFNLVGAGGSSSAANATGSISRSDHYMVVAYLTGGTLGTQFISEEEEHPTSGYAKLRLFNAAASDTGSVDVYVTAHDCTALTTTDTALTAGLSGLQTSFSQILASSAGTTWNVCVTANGDKSQLRLAANAITFKDQQITTLILTHTAGGTLLNGLLVDQQGALQTFTNTLSRLRVVADASGGSQVAATVGGVTFSTTSSPSIGSYLAVPSGAVTSALSIGGVALADPNYTLTAGSDYTLLVAGTNGAPTLTLFTDDNTSSTNTSLPVRMRLVNGVNGLADTASLTSDGTVVADGVTFGAASSYANVAAASDAADLEADTGSISLWSATSQTLTSGSVYTVFLLGDYAPTVVPASKGTLRQDKAGTVTTTTTTTSTDTSTDTSSGS